MACSIFSGSFSFSLADSLGQLLQAVLPAYAYMREEWQCTYFKLDANRWSALPFGWMMDLNATQVDAYRAGRHAVIDGAGPDTFILDCNAPNVALRLASRHSSRITHFAWGASFALMARSSACSTGTTRRARPNFPLAPGPTFGPMRQSQAHWTCPLTAPACSAVLPKTGRNAPVMLLRH